jgi:hypothetical protein
MDTKTQFDPEIHEYLKSLGDPAADEAVEASGEEDPGT